MKVISMKIIIFVDGGIVQEVRANEPCEVLILDYDVQGCDVELMNVGKYTRSDGGTKLAATDFITITSKIAEDDAKIVNNIFAEADHLNFDSSEYDVCNGDGYDDPEDVRIINHKEDDDDR